MFFQIIKLLSGYMKELDFNFEGEYREHLKIGEKYMNWKWYGILDDEFDKSIYEN